MNRRERVNEAVADIVATITPEALKKYADAALSNSITEIGAARLITMTSREMHCFGYYNGYIAALRSLQEIFDALDK